MGEARRAVSARSAFLTVVLILAAGAAAAQQRPPVAPPPADSLERLKQLSLEQLMNVEVMSVSRRAEPLSRAASAIQVITQDDIRRSGVASLPEALRLASNLQVAQVDARQWAISARGFNGTTANKLLVLIDGRTVYTPLYSGVFWDAQDVPITDIDRIEIVSGPGATLWGANAVNGVINVITRRAHDTQGPHLSAGGGTAPLGLGTARYGGTLGNEGRYRIYGRGFARGPSALPSGQGAGDDWHWWQGGFRLDWDASPSDAVTVHGDLYDGRMAQGSGADIVVGGRNLVAGWSRTLFENSSFSTQLYYDRTHRDVPNVFGEDLDTYDLELQHRFPLGARQDVLWGLGYRLINDRVVNSAGLAFLPAHVTRHLFTGFIQDEIAVVPEHLHLALGTKVEHNGYTGVEIQPGGRLNWAIAPSATLWGAVSRAVRTPSRIDRELFIPSQPPFVLTGGPNFRSEVEVAYELGFRHQQGMIAGSVATFYNRYYGLRSVERVSPAAPFPLVIGNGQDGKSYGAELTADWRVTDRWRLGAGYTDLRIEVRPRPGSTDTTRGATESRTPDRQFFARTSVDLPGRLRLDAGLRAIAGIANQSVPAYAEVNARLGWEPVTNVELSVTGQNLLHARHVEFGAPTARREIERSVHAAIEWRFR